MQTGQKQQTVARSSTEAEYRALADATSELVWVQSLMHELCFLGPRVPVIWCDNIGATYLTANPIFHNRMKHIEIAFHYVQELVARKQLQVRYICTQDQTADILSKGLSTTRFVFLHTKLIVSVPSTLISRGDVRVLGQFTAKC